MRLIDEDDWLRELPFLIIACMIHGAVITADPALRWPSPRKDAERSVVVDFVESLPAAPAPVAPPAPEIRKEKPAPAAKASATRAKRLAKRPARTRSRRRASRSASAAAPGRMARGQAVRKGSTTSRTVPGGPIPPGAPRKRLPHSAASKAASRAAALLRQDRLEARRAAARAESFRIHEEKLRAAQAAAARAREETLLNARRKVEISRQLAALDPADEPLAVADARGTLPEMSGDGGAWPYGKGPGTAETSSSFRGAPEQASAALDATADPVYEMEPGPPEGREAVEGRREGSSWSLNGPAGRRPLLARILPESPDWVSRRGLDLSVEIKFQVLPDGSVKSGAVIRRTSGFPEIDRRALEALRRWRFEASGALDPRESWGRVTFRFLMG